MVENLRARNDVEVIACSFYRKTFARHNPLDNLHHSTYLGRHTENVWRTLKFPPLEWWTPTFDIAHGFEHSFPVITNKPWISTIHDIIPMTHPHFFENATPPYFRSVMDYIVKKATAIIFISQTAADSVQEFYPKINFTNRAYVVPLGVNKYFLEEPTATAETTGAAKSISTILPFDAPYLMLSGFAIPRKNFVRAVEAFDLVAGELPHHLVFTGQLGWDSEPLLERIEQSPYKDRIHRLGEVPLDDLREIYRHAAMHLYISLVEGFGLPILEAMACGCPVIASNLSSMPDVAGGAACLVDPYDVSAIADSILKVANDAVYRDELIAKGRVRAKETSWERCTQETIEVYRKVAQK